MKKEAALIILFLLIPNVLALEIKLNKDADAFHPGETLLANLSGNILENIGADQIILYKEHGGHVKLPIFTDIMKIDDTYYIYALLPLNERNYTLTVKDVYFKEGGKTYTQDISKNITVKGDPADFQVNPGVIFTNENFKIDLTSNSDNTNIIKYTYLGEEKEISLSAYDSEEIIFDISKISETILTTILFNSDNLEYSLPAYLIAKAEPIEVINKTLRFIPEREEININKGQTWGSRTKLINPSQNSFEVVFEYPEAVKSIYPISLTIGPGDSHEVDINLELEEVGDFNYKIQAKEKDTGDILSKFLIIAHVGENLTQNSSTIRDVSCTDGEVCEEGQICKGGTLIPTLEGPCCHGGACKKATKDNGTNWFVIIIIVVILAAIVFFVFQQIRKKKGSSKGIIQERGRKYEERFKPEIERVKGSLDRI